MNIRQLAKSLNLSVSTVSRALNGYTDVNENTRARVLNAAKKYGYTANPAARGLRTRSSGLVAFVLSPPQKGFANPFFLDLMVGIEARLHEIGYNLVVVSARSFEDELERFKELSERRIVDGFIFARTRRHDPRISFLQARSIPFATHGRSETGLPAPFLDIDHEIVGNVGCARFIALGHRRIALLNTPSDLMYSHHRRKGYENALKFASIKLDPELIVEEELTEEGGAAGVRRLLALEQPPSAILCGHDLVAMGAMRAINESGRIPGRDVGVIGSDDNPLGPLLSPPLTTFTAPRVAAGRRLAELIVDSMSGVPAEKLQEIWRPELVIRASDGQPLAVQEISAPART